MLARTTFGHVPSPPKPKPGTPDEGALAATASDPPPSPFPSSPPPEEAGPTLTSDGDSEWERCSGFGESDTEGGFGHRSAASLSEAEWEVLASEAGGSAAAAGRKLGRYEAAPPALAAPTKLLAPGALAVVATALPQSLRASPWKVVYRLTDAPPESSLRGLSAALAEHAVPTVVVVQDTSGVVFGGFASVPWNNSPAYQGTSECFVFSVVAGRTHVFSATRANRKYMLLLSDSIAFGGGPEGGPALWIDADLLRGHSVPCATYGSYCLAGEEAFTVEQVEVFAFEQS